MATDDQAMIARRGGGQVKMSSGIAVTMVAGATISGSFTPPAGSRVSIMKSFTPVAFTGAPTNINLTVGKTAGGTDYVAAIDIKAANSSTALTLVSAADYANWPSGQAIFATLTAVGGTNPAGTCTVEVEYSPPNP